MIPVMIGNVSFPAGPLPASSPKVGPLPHPALLRRRYWAGAKRSMAVARSRSLAVTPPSLWVLRVIRTLS